MPNLRLATRNAFDAATLSLSTTSELAAFPLTAMKKTARDTVWRSSDIATQVVRGTWNGDGFVPGMFAMFRHNGTGGSIRVQLYSDAAWTSQVYDSGTVAIAPTFCAIDGFAWGTDLLGVLLTDPYLTEAPYVLYFTPVTCASFQITFSGDGSGWPYWQVTRMWLASYLEATYNPAFGVGLNPTDNSMRSRMLGGSLRSNIGERWRKLDFDLAWISETQRPTFQDAIARVGTGRDVVVSVFPGAGGRLERDYTLNGKLVSAEPITMPNFAYRSKKFSIEEC
jgi:hypothetical protein